MSEAPEVMISHPWWDPRRPAGFRLSLRDAGVIVAGLLLWALLRWLAPEIAMLIPIVLVHFFLFCNVFRIGTRRELTWTAGFVLNVAVWAVLGIIWWAGIALVQTPVTLAVIGWALLSRQYHGLGWRWINPGYTPPFWRNATAEGSADGA